MHNVDDHDSKNRQICSWLFRFILLCTSGGCSGSIWMISNRSLNSSFFDKFNNYKIFVFYLVHIVWNLLCYSSVWFFCPTNFSFCFLKHVPHFYQKGNNNSKTISSESGDLGIVKIFKTLSVSSWYVLRISKDRLFKTSIICYRGKNTRAGIIPNILVLHVSPL